MLTAVVQHRALPYNVCDDCFGLEEWLNADTVSMVCRRRIYVLVVKDRQDAATYQSLVSMTLYVKLPALFRDSQHRAKVRFWQGVRR